LTARVVPFAMSKLVAESIKSGKMLVTGGLGPTATSKRVRLSQGQITVIDGPFTEVKEVIGGFAIMEFKSHEEALESAFAFMELHRKYWPSWEGASEIRQVFGPENYGIVGRTAIANRVPLRVPHESQGPHQQRSFAAERAALLRRHDAAVSRS
jgi:hypothetical protein